MNSSALHKLQPYEGIIRFVVAMLAANYFWKFTVTVTYDPSKTDIRHLKAAFAKINKPAKVHGEPAETERPDKQESFDAQTGASQQVDRE